ncbi:MAG: hypothetical protein A2V86_08715 [Deltaproteobacteria bacterium RBG_16_49_23]|nr:MAG: hypothetical protein A2V86_08715 [Deltaproteobacteria bacterium RBG_16_49_23]
MSETFRTKVLQQLRESGLDVKRPHEFEFYLYLPTELAAKQAAVKLNEREFTTQVQPAAKGDDWLCLATITIVPEDSSLSEIGDLFEQVAKELDGEFDGWEASEAKS